MLLEAHSFGTVEAGAERQAGRPAGRQAKISPLYHRLKDQGANFGARFGWECPLWFTTGKARKGARKAGRSERFKAVATECRGVRERVGILERSSIAKYEISGPGAEGFVDRLCTSRVPKEAGDVAESPMVSTQGGIRCLVTVTRLADGRYYMTAGTEFEQHHLDWMQRHLPPDGSVGIENVTGRFGALLIAGPRSGETLAKLADADLSNNAFPWMTARDIEVGFSPARALKFNAVGEIGWELHHPIEYSAALYESLMEAGKEFGIVNFGLQAMESLRLEKGRRAWGIDVTTETDPFEAGLDNLVALDKGEFIGRPALSERRANSPARTLACLAVDTKDGIGQRGDPVFADGTIVGLVTSAAYGHAVGKSIAFAYLPVEHARPGIGLEVEIPGGRRPATVVESPLYDPHGERTWEDGKIQ